MKKLINQFFSWYEKHLILNTSIAAFLFLIQLIHLYWLTTDVVLYDLIGQKFFGLSGVWETVILVVDYTEIPALITTSLVYLNALRKKFTLKSILYLVFLNSQWLHIFWITDEFVLEHITQHSQNTVLPIWLAWLAISIDYLELPVIYDTFAKLLEAFKKKNIHSISSALKD